MSEDLQSLLEKINRDGVEKAEVEASRIIAAAKAKADAIMTNAREEAAKIKTESEKAADENAKRAAATISNAARDTIISLKGAFSAMLEKLLTKDVDMALSDDATCIALVAEVIKGFTTSGEIVAGTKLAQALKGQLVKLGNFTVVTDDTIGTGFSVKIDGGRVEHAYTADVIAAELAKRIRPDLAALLK